MIHVEDFQSPNALTRALGSIVTLMESLVVLFGIDVIHIEQTTTATRARHTQMVSTCGPIILGARTVPLVDVVSTPVYV